MRFFERQDDSRRATVFLGLVTLVGSIAVAGSGGLLLSGLGVMHEAVDPAAWVDAGVLAGIVALAIMCLAAVAKRIQLGFVTDAVPRSVGATEIATDAANSSYARLRNVVAEMAIAAQVPPPKLFVLESESAIDAFAAGPTPDTASITVSRGCLDTLDRAELQAVVAHEFSHIVNQDIAINLRLVSLTAGLRFFWTVGAGIVGAALRITSGKNQLPALFFSSILCSPLLWMGSFGVFFSRVMQAGISRQREHLADASAVQYTRNPGALIGALEKAAESRRRPAGTGGIRNQLVSHMLFVGSRRRWFDPLATHPPIRRRIELLRLNFGDGPQAG